MFQHKKLILFNYLVKFSSISFLLSVKKCSSEILSSFKIDDNEFLKSKFLILD